MLLTWVMPQFGSVPMADCGCGGVQYVSHIIVGGFTRMLHPRKKHLPVFGLDALTTDEMSIPRFSSTRRFAAPTPVYWPVGLVPATVATPLKTEKLSKYLPLSALRAYIFWSSAATQNGGVFPNSFVVNWTLPSWRWSESGPVPCPAVLLGRSGSTVVQRTFPFAALSAKTWFAWVTK